MERSSKPLGRKKLVPALNRETKCPHAYSDDEELCLEIECNNCPGAQDLANDRCLTGILQILASEAKPETLILKRHIHRRYRESSLATVFAAASELATMNRMLSARSEPSDSKCLTCPASGSKLVDRLRQELLEHPAQFMRDKSIAVARVRKGVERVECARMLDCTASALGSDQRGAF